MNKELFSPAVEEMKVIGNSLVTYIPYFISALLIFALFFFLAFFIKKILKSRLQNKNNNPLVVRALTNICFFVILGLGAYLSLRTGGLSGLAITLIGGTGVIGIALGLALKGTFENYIAGLILSLRKVFRPGDIVEIAGREGIVQAVNSRSTLLMDWEGNNISIPNSDVYSDIIKNFTNNPKMRADFNVGIGYEDSIDQAREVILNVFSKNQNHFLLDPAPVICADGLGSATVNLKVYFWFNARKQSIIKTKSLAVQLVKEALMDADISMPDDAREIVFATPLEIRRTKQGKQHSAKTKPNWQYDKDANDSKVLQQGFIEPTDRSSSKEIDISTEADDIRKQLRHTKQMEEGENLLR